MWEDFISWVCAVAAHWVVLMSGVAASIFTVIAAKLQKQPPWKLSKWVFIIFLFVAFFLAWRDQYRTVKKLTTDNTEIAATNTEMKKDLANKIDEIKRLTERSQNLETQNKVPKQENVSSKNQQGGVTAGTITGGTFNVNPPSSMPREEAKKNQQQLNEWAAGLLKNCNKLEMAFDEKPSITLLKWSRQLAELANDRRPDLNKLLWHGLPRIPIEYIKRQNELVAQAEFTLNCLEANGYIRLAKIDLVNPWYEKSFQNVAIEFKDKWQQVTQ
jgi:hypothetical protein